MTSLERPNLSDADLFGMALMVSGVLIFALNGLCTLVFLAGPLGGLIPPELRLGFALEVMLRFQAPTLLAATVLILVGGWLYWRRPGRPCGGRPGKPS